MAATKKQQQDEEQKVERTVDSLLSEEMPRSAAGNATYWVTTVLGAMALNLVLLILLAR